jgi:hypothetical protein
LRFRLPVLASPCDARGVLSVTEGQSEASTTRSVMRIAYRVRVCACVCLCVSVHQNLCNDNVIRSNTPRVCGCIRAGVCALMPVLAFMLVLVHAWASFGLFRAYRIASHHVVVEPHTPVSHTEDTRPCRRWAAMRCALWCCDKRLWCCGV